MKPETTVCYGDEFFQLCDRQKTGEIVIYSVSRGETNAQWIVKWAGAMQATVEKPQPPVKRLRQSELF